MSNRDQHQVFQSVWVQNYDSGVNRGSLEAVHSPAHQTVKKLEGNGMKCILKRVLDGALALVLEVQVFLGGCGTSLVPPDQAPDVPSMSETKHSSTSWEQNKK